MKRWIIPICSIVTLLGCSSLGVQTPAPIIQAGQISASIQLDAQKDMNKVIDAYNQSLKDMTTEKYALWMKQAEILMKDENGNVNLEQYKAALAECSVEIDKANQYFDSVATRFKSEIGAKLAASQMLTGKVNDYNTETGVSEESIQMLGDALIGLVPEKQEKPESPTQYEQMMDFLNRTGLIGSLTNAQ